MHCSSVVTQALELLDEEMELLDLLEDDGVIDELLDRELDAGVLDELVAIELLLRELLTAELLDEELITVPAASP